MLVACAKFVVWTKLVVATTTTFVDLMLSGLKTVQPALSFWFHFVCQATCALSRSGIGASSFVCPAATSFLSRACLLVCSTVGSLINGSGFGLFPSMTDSSRLLKNE